MVVDRRTMCGKTCNGSLGTTVMVRRKAGGGRCGLWSHDSGVKRRARECCSARVCPTRKTMVVHGGGRIAVQGGMDEGNDDDRMMVLDEGDKDDGQLLIVDSWSYSEDLESD
ncbi:hypothetical protein L1987_18400 [Smallanthus sonchifolius]|uniref:Uncharacterized protein n=1 Tax=Smallanthus sonchifolius TaxID=185202 RepID=A0ACB9J1P2_9ASTR|nr:hypothetical protein L1987_18400 [Smallanthus sonchifolius]